VKRVALRAAITAGACAGEKPPPRVVAPSGEPTLSGAAASQAAPLFAKPKAPPTQPLPIGGPPPSLYEAALAARLQKAIPIGGEADVRVRLDAEGHIIEHRVLRATDPGVEPSLAAGLRRYAPGGEATLPVPTDERIREAVLGEGVVVRVRPAASHRGAP
jgi:hypothetical protein